MSPEFICAGCEKSDRLYHDSHGTFCFRCGPGMAVKPEFVWYYGLTVDQEGRITEYTRQNGRLRPCPSTE